MGCGEVPKGNSDSVGRMVAVTEGGSEEHPKVQQPCVWN